MSRDARRARIRVSVVKIIATRRLSVRCSRIREKSDAGMPVVASDPDGPLAQCYRDIAARVRDGLQVASRSAPKIVIEA